MAENGNEADSKQPVSDIQDSVSFVQKGCKLTKFGSNGKRYQRFFFVDRKTMALCYTGSRKRPGQHGGSGNLQVWVPIRKIVEVVKVDGTAKRGPRRGKHQSLFTLAVSHDDEQPKTLIAASTQERDTWVSGLRHLVSARAVDDPLQQERMWLHECFASADRNRDDLLDEDEVARLINSLNVSAADADCVKQQMRSQQKLDVDQFIELYNKLGKNRQLEELFKKYATTSQQYMTVDELAQFFQTEQSEEIAPDTLKHIVACCEPCPEFRDRDWLSMTGFSVMFTSTRMNIRQPRCLDVYQDMTRPLSQYFINSSHNTYLAGHQTVGSSSVEQYRQVLSDGCRCVELDVWDGDDGEPVLFHGVKGYTITSKVLLQDVLAAINDCAFVNNEQPVIISLENHVSESQQGRMAELIRTTFGERLYCEPMWQGDAQFPSPDELKHRVIIQGKKPSASSDEEDSEDEEPPDGVEVVDGSKQLRQYRKALVEPTQELASCVSFYQTQPFKSFEQSSSKLSFLNISESNVGRWTQLDGGRPFVSFNTQKLSRVYPAWWRLWSTNYNPVPNWMSGCQIVSLNFQTRDVNMALNEGLFEDNGRCGYVLKPEFMRSSDSGFGQDLPAPSDWLRRLTLTVISGHMLPKRPGDSNTTILDPYVQIELHGIAADWKVERTKTITNNGFNPVWNETKQFDVTCPQLALVLFRVKDDGWLGDTTVAEYCLPMRCIQTGYRMIALQDRDGDTIGPTGLLVHISIDENSA